MLRRGFHIGKATGAAHSERIGRSGKSTVRLLGVTAERRDRRVGCAEARLEAGRVGIPLVREEVQVGLEGDSSIRVTEGRSDALHRHARRGPQARGGVLEVVEAELGPTDARGGGAEAAPVEALVVEALRPVEPAAPGASARLPAPRPQQRRGVVARGVHLGEVDAQVLGERSRHRHRPHRVRRLGEVLPPAVGGPHERPLHANATAMDIDVQRVGLELAARSPA